MAQEGYILVTGGAGDFTGDMSRTGAPKKSSLLYSFNYGVSHAIDESHHVFTGKRVYSVVTTEICIDSSVAQYYQELVNADSTSYKPLKVTMGLFRQDQTNLGLIGFGDQKPYLTIELADARVGAVRFQHGAREERLQTDRLEVDFTFRKITVTFQQGGKTFTDSWDGA
jgi:type VI secretion system Hcp family effector